MHKMQQSVHLLTHLRAIVGDAGIVGEGDLALHENGARYGAGKAHLVVRPATVEEVSEVVKTCIAHHVPLIAQGANTGLVGASTPDASGHQVVLSLTRLRQPMALDAGNRSVDAGAGLRLHELNDFLSEDGFWFPIDLSADPTIGGMVAANTGGTRLIRYGDVRHNVLALEIVLFNPPGQIVRLGRALRKDNTGPDLKHLFIGTADSFGIVVGATLQVHHKPVQTATALVIPVSSAAVNILLSEMERQFGDWLAAFEGMSGNALDAAIAHIPDLRNPFHPEILPEFAILVKLETCLPIGRTGKALQEMLDDFLEEQFGFSIMNAAVGKRAALWSLRHGLSEGAKALGPIIAFDVSVPRSSIMHFRELAIALVSRYYPWLRPVDFGHIADGGLHFNVVWPRDSGTPYDAETVSHLRDAIYALAVEQFGGSFSAEHGVGPHNATFCQRYTNPLNKSWCGALKFLFDPEKLGGRVDFGPGIFST